MTVAATGRLSRSAPAGLVQIEHHESAPSGRATCTSRLLLQVMGSASGLILKAQRGLGFWDVLHQRLAERLGVGGWPVIGAGAGALIVWLALGERPEVANVVLAGIAVDASIAVLSTSLTVSPNTLTLYRGSCAA